MKTTNMISPTSSASPMNMAVMLFGLSGDVLLSALEGKKEIYILYI